MYYHGSPWQMAVFNKRNGGCTARNEIQVFSPEDRSVALSNTVEDDFLALSILGLPGNVKSASLEKGSGTGKSACQGH